MRFLAYYSYTDKKGKKQLRDNTRKDDSITGVMNYFMSRMGEAGYTDRSVDQVIPLTAKFHKKERGSNHHTEKSKTQRGYSDFEKEFIFDHFSQEGPEYCAIELDTKMPTLKAYAARMRRKILEGYLEMLIEAFMPPAQITVGG